MSADVSQGDWTVLALGGLPMVAVACLGMLLRGLVDDEMRMGGIVAGLAAALVRLVVLHILGDAVSISELDQLLEQRWPGKVRCGLALRLSRRSESRQTRKNSSYYFVQKPDRIPQ